uniref:Uncharacterized protein n=1 Tax=Mucochytrium quahogii TaxID=96639 RepID=A0A7S2W9L8_9STRA
MAVHDRRTCMQGIGNTILDVYVSWELVLKPIHRQPTNQLQQLQTCQHALGVFESLGPRFGASTYQLPSIPSLEQLSCRFATETPSQANSMQTVANLASP